MDLDRITHPLRLAKGSHQPGSGKGCAMNAISYINGDAQVTDFPACSARPLAALVQSCNDLLAGPGGYLSPDNSLLALELGWRTVGTADVADSVIHAWVAELLTNPTWGSSATPKSLRSKRSSISPSYTATSPRATRHPRLPGTPPIALHALSAGPQTRPDCMPCGPHPSRPQSWTPTTKRR